MDETTENCGILIQIKEEHVVTSCCHFAFWLWCYAGGLWPSHGGGSSGGRWFWWLTVCLGGGGGRRHCLCHVCGGQGAFVLAGGKTVSCKSESFSNAKFHPPWRWLQWRWFGFCRPLPRAQTRPCISCPCTCRSQGPCRLLCTVMSEHILLDEQGKKLGKKPCTVLWPTRFH